MNNFFFGKEKEAGGVCRPCSFVPAGTMGVLLYEEKYTPVSF